MPNNSKKKAQKVIKQFIVARNYYEVCQGSYLCLFSLEKIFYTQFDTF